MSCPSHGVMVRTKIIVRHDVCPAWLQKTTVTSEGPRDQQIEVQKAATCKHCRKRDNADCLRVGGPSQPPKCNDTPYDDGHGS